jgi:hypothetical protein
VEGVPDAPSASSSVPEPQAKQPPKRTKKAKRKNPRTKTHDVAETAEQTDRPDTRGSKRARSARAEALDDEVQEPARRLVERAPWDNRRQGWDRPPRLDRRPREDEPRVVVREVVREPEPRVVQGPEHFNPLRLFGIFGRP